MRPTPSIVAIESSMPSSSAPESPMKIFAGWKFHGRKPRHMPTAITESSAAAEASPNVLGVRIM